MICVLHETVHPFDDLVFAQSDPPSNQGSSLPPDPDELLELDTCKSLISEYNSSEFMLVWHCRQSENHMSRHPRLTDLGQSVLLLRTLQRLKRRQGRTK